MTSTMVAVDGGEVWADDTGGDGPPLVLLHPGVGDSRIWDPLLAVLTAKYRVIRYDARGFGQSPAPAVRFSLLRDLAAVLGHYGVQRAAIVGCSQGGGSALGLALEQPERVSALVLLCPGIPGFPFPEEDEDDPLAAEYERAHAAGDVDALAGVMRQVWARAGATQAVMEQLRSAARASISAGDLEVEDQPVFDAWTLHGSAALMWRCRLSALVEADRQAAALIPECEFLFVPGSDHRRRSASRPVP